MKNAIILYYALGVTIDYLPIFFGLVFEVNFDDFQKSKSLISV